MGKMQRVKGAVFERRVVRIARRAGLASKRGIGQSRAANEVPDVDLEGFWPECKHHQRTNPRAAYRQAKRDSKGTGRVPVAICLDNAAKEPEVHLGLRDFLELVYAARHYVRGVDPGDGPPREPQAKWLVDPKGDGEDGDGGDQGASGEGTAGGDPPG